VWYCRAREHRLLRYPLRRQRQMCIRDSFRGRGGDRGGRGGRGGGRGGPRGGRGGGFGRGGRGGAKGGAQVIVEPHERFPGVFIIRGKEDALGTKNITPGESVYQEKRVSV